MFVSVIHVSYLRVWSATIKSISCKHFRFFSILSMVSLMLSLTMLGPRSILINFGQETHWICESETIFIQVVPHHASLVWQWASPYAGKIPIVFWEINFMEGSWFIHNAAILICFAQSINFRNFFLTQVLREINF